MICLYYTLPVFGVRAFCSAQIQFEHLLRLPSFFGEVLERKRTRNSSAISRYLSAISATRAPPKSVQSQSFACNPCDSVCLHLTLLAHLFATKVRASICVSMGPAGIRYCTHITHIHIRRYAYTYTDVHIHVRVHLHVRVYIHIYIYIHTDMYVYTYIYVAELP